MAEYVPSLEVVLARREMLVEHEESSDYWARMAERMEMQAKRWWDTHDLTVLRSACAGTEMRHHTALWGKGIVDVVRTL